MKLLWMDRRSNKLKTVYSHTSYSVGGGGGGGGYHAEVVYLQVFPPQISLFSNTFSASDQNHPAGTVTRVSVVPRKVTVKIKGAENWWQGCPDKN